MGWGGGGGQGVTRQGATGEMFIPINPETWSLNLQQMVYSRSQGKGMVKQGQGIYKGVGWGGVGWRGGVEGEVVFTGKMQSPVFKPAETCLLNLQEMICNSSHMVTQGRGIHKGRGQWGREGLSVTRRCKVFKPAGTCLLNLQQMICNSS